MENETGAKSLMFYYLLMDALDSLDNLDNVISSHIPVYHNTAHWGWAGDTLLNNYLKTYKIIWVGLDCPDWDEK